MALGRPLVAPNTPSNHNHNVLMKGGRWADGKRPGRPMACARLAPVRLTAYRLCRGHLGRPPLRSSSVRPVWAGPFLTGVRVAQLFFHSHLRGQGGRDRAGQRRRRRAQSGPGPPRPSACMSLPGVNGGAQCFHSKLARAAMRYFRVSQVSSKPGTQRIVHCPLPLAEEAHLPRPATAFHVHNRGADTPPLPRGLRPPVFPRW